MNTNDLINNWISQSDFFVDYLETLKYEELDKFLFSYKDYDIAIAEALKEYGNKLNTDENLEIYDKSDKVKFVHYLKIHQQGETDYFAFCKHCAETGIEKWIMSLQNMTCTYFDKSGKEI